MNKSRNMVSSEPARFGARSLALSLLLGSHPPRLTTSALVQTGELFGITKGAMRTALSRMAQSGEVEATGRGYALAGRLIERQRRQDSGRRSASEPWDGRWYTVAPEESSRSIADRRELRRVLEAAGFGELRPDYWLRPANIPFPDLGPALIVVTGDLDVEDVNRLVAQLWPLDELNASAEGFLRDIDDLERSRSRDEDGLPAWLVPAFTVSADIVRFLMKEPRLPSVLLPEPWAPELLRNVYDKFEATFQHEMARFLAAG